MIDLGNGQVYLNQGEPAPFGCPQCSHPVAFTQKPYVTCPTCGIQAHRNEFQSIRWQELEIN